MQCSLVSCLRICSEQSYLNMMNEPVGIDGILLSTQLEADDAPVGDAPTKLLACRRPLMPTRGHQGVGVGSSQLKTTKFQSSRLKSELLQ